MSSDISFMSLINDTYPMSIVKLVINPYLMSIVAADQDDPTVRIEIEN